MSRLRSLIFLVVYLATFVASQDDGEEEPSGPAPGLDTPLNRYLLASVNLSIGAAAGVLLGLIILLVSCLARIFCRKETPMDHQPLIVNTGIIAVPQADYAYAPEHQAQPYGAQSYDSKGYEAQGYNSKSYEAQGYDTKSYEAQGYDSSRHEAPSYPSHQGAIEL